MDLTIIVLYLLAMVLVGLYFSKGNKNTRQFTSAGGKVPGWAIGLSMYATFLSSNTFLGVPGKAFGGNWNAFVFSLSMPVAAWVAAKWFVPFYRTTGEVSAYTHLEKRFGLWARTFAVICFLLTQLARIGSVFFGIALSLQALIGLSMTSIMVVMGICIIFYTLLGGLEAVIWTEVVQAIVKTFGALLILLLVIHGIPGGISRMIEIGRVHQKFSLGSFSPDFRGSTFWVVLLYGFFINLNNFGVDQNYIQRYHAAKSRKEASRSLWMCVGIYLPASLLFFVIGSSLFSYYSLHPHALDLVKFQAARERLPAGTSLVAIRRLAGTLGPQDYGDKVMPFFMVDKIPSGLVGLIVSAILSAAMSTISSGMNASATVFTEDIYRRYFNKQATDRQQMRILYGSTVVVGILGILTGIAIIGTKSVLDVWWALSGIFAAGMLGIFLLGIASRRTTNAEGFIATVIGILVILWMTFSPRWKAVLGRWVNPLQIDMTIVVGTLTIFLLGVGLSRMKKRRGPV